MKRYSFLIILCFALSFTMQAQNQPLAKHVVLIGLDGWAAHDFEHSHDIPNILNLMQGGSYSMHKRCVLPALCPNSWASLFMGVGPETHGYTQKSSVLLNSSSHGPEVSSLVTNENGIFPTIFSVIREQFPEAETGCTYEWIGIEYLIDKLSISHVKYFSAGSGHLEENCDSIARYISEKKPVFFAPCFDGIDGVGHSNGWYSPAYYNYVARVDRCIGRIIQALKDAGIYDETIIIVTVDHGGYDHDHGRTLSNGDLEIHFEEIESPLIFFGKNVRSGYQIQEPVVQYDIAATIAYILGLETPSAWRGKPTTEVFIK